MWWSLYWGINVTPSFSHRYLLSARKTWAKRPAHVTSLFSFKSILQCSLETWGSCIRISQSGFLRRPHELIFITWGKNTQKQIHWTCHKRSRGVTLCWRQQQSYTEKNPFREIVIHDILSLCLHPYPTFFEKTKLIYPHEMTTIIIQLKVPSK